MAIKHTTKNFTMVGGWKDITLMLRDISKSRWEDHNLEPTLMFWKNSKPQLGNLHKRCWVNALVNTLWTIYDNVHTYPTDPIIGRSWQIQEMDGAPKFHITISRYRISSVRPYSSEKNLIQPTQPFNRPMTIFHLGLQPIC